MTFTEKIAEGDYVYQVEAAYISTGKLSTKAYVEVITGISNQEQNTEPVININNKTLLLKTMEKYNPSQYTMLPVLKYFIQKTEKRSTYKRYLSELI